MSEKEHIQIQGEVESVILDSVTNFNAVIKVKGTKAYYCTCQCIYACMCACTCVCVCCSYLCTQLTIERGRLVVKQHR